VDINAEYLGLEQNFKANAIPLSALSNCIGSWYFWSFDINCKNK
jgi:hypothetical protein